MSLPTLPPCRIGWRRIFLIRHGETEANSNGLMQGSRLHSELSAKGHNQAQAVGDLLVNTNIGLICTSALHRTIQTASYISTTNRRLLHLHELNEMDYGADWDGKPIKTVLTEIRSLSKNWAMGNIESACPNGGESPKDVLSRAIEGFRKIAEHSNKYCTYEEVTVVVAHNFVNKIFLCHSVNGDLKDFQKIEQQNACVNVLEMDTTTYEVNILLMNYAHHVSTL